MIPPLSLWTTCRATQAAMLGTFRLKSRQEGFVLSWIVSRRALRPTTAGRDDCFQQCLAISDSAGAVTVFIGAAIARPLCRAIYKEPTVQEECPVRAGVFNFKRMINLPTYSAWTVRSPHWTRTNLSIRHNAHRRGLCLGRVCVRCHFPARKRLRYPLTPDCGTQAFDRRRRFRGEFV